MAHQYHEYHEYHERDPEREETPLDTPEQPNQEPRAAGERENEKRSGRASGRSNKREAADEKAGGGVPKQPRRTRKSTPEPRAVAGEESGEPQSGGGSIIQLPLRGGAGSAGDADVLAEQDEDPAVHELEAQGFTPDEAIRLIHVSDRVATSREAREAEAELRRLRFTRWLIERGVLDEFSA